MYEVTSFCYDLFGNFVRVCNLQNYVYNHILVKFHQVWITNILKATKADGASGLRKLGRNVALAFRCSWPNQLNLYTEDVYSKIQLGNDSIQRPLSKSPVRLCRPLSVINTIPCITWFRNFIIFLVIHKYIQQ